MSLAGEGGAFPEFIVRISYRRCGRNRGRAPRPRARRRTPSPDDESVADPSRSETEPAFSSRLVDAERPPKKNPRPMYPPPHPCRSKSPRTGCGHWITALAGLRAGLAGRSTARRFPGARRVSGRPRISTFGGPRGMVLWSPGADEEPREVPGYHHPPQALTVVREWLGRFESACSNNTEPR